MENQLGRAFDTPWKQRAAAAIAYAVIIVDWVWTYYGPEPNTWRSAGVRFGIGVVGVVLMLVAARGDRGTIGLRLRPAPSWRYWIVVSLLVGVVMAAFVASIYGVLYWCGYRRFGPTIAPELFWRVLAESSTVWPLVEEPIYRMLLCAAMLPLIGRWGAVLAGGAAFACMHYFIYGPDNWQPNVAIAGFLFAWAFVRSGSILIPLLWHAVGNAAVIVLALILWKLQNG